MAMLKPGDKRLTRASCYGMSILLLLAVCLCAMLLGTLPISFETWKRASRNIFVPRPIVMDAVYPATSNATLVRDITVVVSSKDFVSPSIHSLNHLQSMIPDDMRVIFTYPRPIDNSSAWENEMRKACGSLKNVEFIPMDSFANPFAGWVDTRPMVKTKYTLFMHNDVYPMNPEFVSELYNALEEHPLHGVAAPQIYESQELELEVPHTINTNLHMRRRESGRLYLSHEVDLAAGTVRTPEDFRHGEQRDFLEDHAMMMRADLTSKIVDPAAAYTLEYMDMQMNLRANNISVWFTPSAAVEFRVVSSRLQWNDLCFFVHRRSEKLARQTKGYLERKWNLEFPNTGFAAYVKFSILGGIHFARSALPNDWKTQMPLVTSWFEFVGFNEYSVSAGSTDAARSFRMLPELLSDPTLWKDVRNSTLTAKRNLRHMGADLVHSNFTAARTVEQFLPELENSKNIETRLGFEYLSYSVAKVTIRKEAASTKKACDTGRINRIRDYCGLLIEENNQCTCWLYIAPFSTDNLLTQIFHLFLRTVKLPMRVSLYFWMNYGLQDLSTLRMDMMRFKDGKSTDISVCGEHQEDCTMDYSFPEGAELLQWSGRLNSWGTVQRILSAASGERFRTGTHGKWFSPQYCFAAIILVVVFMHFTNMTPTCLLASVWLLGIWLLSDTASTMTLLSVLAFVAFLVHLPFIPRRCAVYTAIISCIAATFLFGSAGAGVSTDTVMWTVTVVVLALGLRRLLKLAYSLKQTAPLSIIAPVSARILPSYSYDENSFFNADGASAQVAEKRRSAFRQLETSWVKKFQKSIQTSNDLQGNLSDLRFASVNRVFFPFNKLLGETLDPCTVVTKTDRMDLIDTDGNKLMDAAGSYGVNVCGYERYKKFMAEGLNEVKELGSVLGPLHPLTLDNVRRLQKISGQQEVSFHMSGTEAVMSAVRVARFNTKKKFIVVMGGSYHGWWDGVQSLAGNERYPRDVLTLKEGEQGSLNVLAARRREIAAVLINPLQAFHMNMPPPSDLTLASNTRSAGVNTQYAEWLKSVKLTCEQNGIVFILDEVYTGFRLAPGGAQEYWGVKADLVVYGKTLGGGCAVGVVCGRRDLMARTDDSKPLRVNYVVGTFAANPLQIACMNKFLQWVESDEAKRDYDALSKSVPEWVKETNARLEKEKLPLSVAAYSSVWTMLYKQPSRYHWMLQYYLKDEGVSLSWVGTGRLNFSLDFTPADMQRLQDAIVRACKRMIQDGWWYAHDDEILKTLASKIKFRVATDILAAVVAGATSMLTSKTNSKVKQA